MTESETTERVQMLSLPDLMTEDRESLISAYEKILDDLDVTDKNDAKTLFEISVDWTREMRQKFSEKETGSAKPGRSKHGNTDIPCLIADWIGFAGYIAKKIQSLKRGLKMSCMESVIRNICELLGQNADDPDFSMILCAKDEENRFTIIHGTETSNILSSMAMIINDYLLRTHPRKNYLDGLDRFFDSVRIRFSIKEAYGIAPDIACPLDPFVTGRKDFSLASCLINRYSTKYLSCKRKQLNIGKYEALIDSINEKINGYVSSLPNNRFKLIISYYYAWAGGTVMSYKIGQEPEIPDVVITPLQIIHASSIDKDKKRLPFDTFTNVMKQLVVELNDKTEV